MRSLFRTLVLLITALAPWQARAAGTIPFALTQVMDVNGRPVAGALLNIYVVGTVATPQIAYQDTALTLPLPWPLQADVTGRFASFYLSDGSVHVRLTDPGGGVILDIPNLLVIGPSGGGGGGGGTVDPTSIASTGDVKFRPGPETLPGWVRMNGLTIGNALSGADTANNNTQALFIWLWTNCPDLHCPVPGGRGGTALGDFNANKKIGMPDWRGRTPVGLDAMGAASSGRILGSNVTSGSDTPDTPFGTGGESNHTLVTAELAAHTHGGVTDTGGAHNHGGATGAHDHGGVTGTDSASHTHTVSGTTDNAGAHNHSYTITNVTASNITLGSSFGGVTQAGASTSTNGDHNHPFSTTSGSASTTHSHTIASATASISTDGSHQHTFTTSSAGADTAHNNMQPFMLGTWYQKL